MAKVDAAQKDGSWRALDAIKALEIPPDLEAALALHASAQHHFDTFPPSVRRGILARIANAKRPQTRAKRVEETARLAEKNLRTYEWRR
jgi:uncharacterized protein YdeI (YjbR/CyaY-like superfamily)